MRIKQLNVDWLRYGKLVMALGGLLVLISLGSILFRGFNFGVDFTGGTTLEVMYADPVELDDVRERLEARELPVAQLQYFGTVRDVMIRLAPQEGLSNAQVSETALQALRTGGVQVELKRVEFVGPQVGSELTEKGLAALIWAMVGIMVYVAFRFEWRFAVGAAVASAHDVIVVAGLFSLTGMEFDLNVLAALLATLGYSLNDTVVVFDRVRENFLRLRKDDTREIMNISINQTMSRTIITGGTMLLAVSALYLFGTESLAGFSLALLIGVVAGIYSTIWIASMTALLLGVSKADLAPPVKEGAGDGSQP